MKNSHASHSNKIATAVLRKIAVVSAVFGLFAGCGQRGSLYLPTVPEAAQRSSIVETLAVPATNEADKNSTFSTRSPMTQPATK
jgi:predicted small lipoprotein YifL